MVREDEEDDAYNMAEDSDLETYLREVGQGRARTAPLRAGKQAEQYKQTPGFA